MILDEIIGEYDINKKINLAQKSQNYLGSLKNKNINQKISLTNQDYPLESIDIKQSEISLTYPVSLSHRYHMITSSEFFKKTFFDLEFENPVDKSTAKKNQNSHINNQQLHRYSQLSNFTHNKNAQKFSTTKRIPSKDFQTLSSTKNRFNQNYKQIQKSLSQKKHIHHPKQLDQFTIDVTPWNQQSSLTSRQVYDSKQNLINAQRQKIKSTISKYKFTRTIQETDNKQHANFIKSPKKNKKISYILYEYGNRESKEGKKEKINLIKNVDLNKSYEQYLNHQIDFDKDFFFKSHTKVKTHNRQGEQYLGNSNSAVSREGKNSKTIVEKGQEKEFMDDIIKRDLVCSRYKDEIKKQGKRETGQEKKQQEDQIGGHGGAKLKEKAKLLDKGKILKFQMNRRIFKGTKISLNGIVPIMNNNSVTERQKFTFEISGNKTRKLDYSHLTN